jgi:competence protein ComEA
MRRSADQQQIDDLARRRLDALLAELGGEPRPGPGPLRAERESLWEEAPRPGRHAHRPLSTGARVGGWLQDRLPETLRGRVTLGPAQLGVVALLLACGVLWAAWTTSRTSPEPVAASSPVVVAPTSGPASTGGSGAALATSAGPAAETTAGTMAGTTGGAPAATVELVVDVQGTVRRPGIVVLPTGSRVVDALDAAGGYTGRRARLASLNLARPLVDGEQILVGRTTPAAPVPSALASAPGPGDASALVSLNTADQTALETLPGVGPVTATAILQWRDEHGPFTAVEQLLEVSGIGEKTLAQIAPFVTL